MSGIRCGQAVPGEHEWRLDRGRQLRPQVDRHVVAEPEHVLRPSRTSATCDRSSRIRRCWNADTLCEPLRARRLQADLLELGDHVGGSLPVAVASRLASLHRVVCEGPDVTPPSRLLVVRRLVLLREGQDCPQSQPLRRRDVRGSGGSSVHHRGRRPVRARPGGRPRSSRICKTESNEVNGGNGSGLRSDSPNSQPVGPGIRFLRCLRSSVCEIRYVTDLPLSVLPLSRIDSPPATNRHSLSARAGAPPVRGKGACSHPTGSHPTTNLLPALIQADSGRYGRKVRMPRNISSATSADTLRKQARRWMKALRSGDADARARFEHAYPAAAARAGAARRAACARARVRARKLEGADGGGRGDLRSRRTAAGPAAAAQPRITRPWRRTTCWPSIRATRPHSIV